MNAGRLVVFGPMRSGNVLLESLLRAQPAIAPGPCLDRMLLVAQRLGLGLTTPLARPMREYMAHLVAAEALTAVSADEFATVNELHRILLIRARRQDDAWVVARMHNPIAFLEQLAAIEDVRCVCLVRDVRDVVLSRAYRGDLDLDAYVEQWRRFAGVARSLRGRPRVLVLRFEDVVLDPTRAAAELGRLTGIRIQFPDARETGDIEWPDHSSFGRLPRHLEAGAVGRWRSNTSQLVEYAGWSCRAELEQWRYEAPDSRGLAAGRRASFELRRLASRLAHDLRDVRLRLVGRLLPPLAGR